MAFLRHFIPGGKERLSGEGSGTSETIGIGGRILYVPSPIITHSNHLAVVSEFERNGYEIRTTIKPPTDSSSDRSLGLGGDEGLRRNPSKDRLIANLAGIEQPQEYQLSEILRSPRPAVAKSPLSNRGESVFLLDGKESVAKFLAFQNEGFNSGWDRKQKNENIEATKRAIELKQWDWEGFSQIVVSDELLFQEYIETPSNYYTSFRIVVDGYGNVHYGTLLRSPQPKGVKRVADRNQNPIDHSFTYLHNPRSMYCLDAPDIVSNAAQGGIGIQLNGMQIEDQTNRDVVQAHGIDPDNPSIPQQIKDKASKVGKVTRWLYPFVGVDFIYDRQLNDFFLEANASPALFAEGLGVSKQEIRRKRSKEHEQEYLARVLIRRIVKNAPR